ncbi:MAG: exo-alpha-sialidase [Planctomycetota bacterium]|nr:MAG: exo-alpha-sialidase [Planctomycetota bacterium]
MSKILVGFLAALCLAANLSAQQAREQVRVDDPVLGNSPAGFYTVVDGEGDLRAGLWLDDRVNTSDEDIFMVISQDNGLSWSSEIDVTGGSASLIDVDYPQLLVRNGLIHVLWDDDRTATSSDDTTEYKGYDANGNLVNNVVIPVTTYTHELGADGNYVAIAYTGRQSGVTLDELYVVWSTDGGLTWPNLATPVAFDPANIGLYDVDGYQVVVQDQGAGNWAIHLFVEDDRNGNDDLWYGRIDNGGALGPVVRLDEDPSGTGTIFYLSTANTIHAVADGNNVHVSWTEDNRASAGTNEAVYYRRSTDGGDNWDPEQQIGGYTVGTDDVDYANLAADGDVVAVAWSDNRTGEDPMYISVSNDGGATFGAETMIPGGGTQPAEAQYNRLFVDGNWIVAACEDDSYTASSIDEYPVFVFSNDGGATWSAPILCGLFNDDEDIDMADEAWYFGNGSLSGLWQTDGGSLDGDSVEVGGMRLPYIRAVVDSIGRTVALELAGEDVASAGTGFARWAASTVTGTVVHPENPALQLDLGASGILALTLSPGGVAKLSALLQADGSASVGPYPLPPSATGKTAYVQGWVNLGGLGGYPSDVLTLVLP